MRILNERACSTYCAPGRGGMPGADGAGRVGIPGAGRVRLGLGARGAGPDGGTRRPDIGDGLGLLWLLKCI